MFFLFCMSNTCETYYSLARSSFFCLLSRSFSLLFPIPTLLYHSPLLHSPFHFVVVVLLTLFYVSHPLKLKTLSDFTHRRFRQTVRNRGSELALKIENNDTEDNWSMLLNWLCIGVMYTNHSFHLSSEYSLLSLLMFSPFPFLLLILLISEWPFSNSRGPIQDRVRFPLLWTMDNIVICRQLDAHSRGKFGYSTWSRVSHTHRSYLG